MGVSESVALAPMRAPTGSRLGHAAMSIAGWAPFPEGLAR